VQSWHQGCMARELDNGSISGETKYKFGNKFVQQENFMMDQFQKIKGADGSVAEEAECKVSSKCVARTCDNGSVPEKLGCKVGEKLVNKKLIPDQLQKNTGCRVGSKVVWQENVIMDQLQKKQSAKLVTSWCSKRTRDQSHKKQSWSQVGIVKKKLVISLTRNKVQSWHQGCRAREVDSGSSSSETKCKVGNKFV